MVIEETIYLCLGGDFMFCPECGNEITSTGKFNLGINNSGEYICENCNIKINIYEEELDNPYSYENSDAYLDMN